MKSGRGFVLAALATAACSSEASAPADLRGVEPCAGEVVEIRPDEGLSDVDSLVYEGSDIVFNFDNVGEAGSLVLDTSDGVLVFSWQGLAVEGEVQHDVSAELRLDANDGECLALSDGELLFDDQECRLGRFRFSLATTAGECGIDTASIEDGVEGCFRAPVPPTSACSD
jgi:hypothetical protein